MQAKNVTKEEWTAIREDIARGSSSRKEDCGAPARGSGQAQASGQAQGIGVKVQFLDHKASPSKAQWNNVEDLIKILKKTDDEATIMYSKMSDFLEDRPGAEVQSQGNRMLNELEDLGNVM